MGATARVMATTNKQFSAVKMQQVMQQFERQNAEMEMKEELSRTHEAVFYQYSDII